VIYHYFKKTDMSKIKATNEDNMLMMARYPDENDDLPF
jgi:serine/threonine protein phosphatase PrpC